MTPGWFSDERCWVVLECGRFAEIWAQNSQKGQAGVKPANENTTVVVGTEQHKLRTMIKAVWRPQYTF